MTEDKKGSDIIQLLGAFGQVEPPASGALETARAVLWSVVAEEMLSAAPADDDDQEKLEREYLDVPLEADEADVAEQSVEVDPDEDDEYR